MPSPSTRIASGGDMTNNSDSEWLRAQSARHIAACYCQSEVSGERALYGCLENGSIKSRAKIAMIKHGRGQSVKVPDYEIAPEQWETRIRGSFGFLDDWNAGRFTFRFVDSTMRPHDLTIEAHGVRLCAADVDEWFPVQATSADDPGKEADTGDPEVPVDDDATPDAAPASAVAAPVTAGRRFQYKTQDTPRLNAVRKFIEQAQNAGRFDRDAPTYRSFDKMHQEYIDYCHRNKLTSSKPYKVSYFKTLLGRYSNGQWR
jgi:hypothetical protein